MVNRYGYVWEFESLSGQGFDADHNPIDPTSTWEKFDCDVQTGAGKFVTGTNGDRIDVTYSIFTKKDIRKQNIVTNAGDVILTNEGDPIVVGEGIETGGKVRDLDGNEFVILQIFDYKLNFEIWV